MGLMDVAASLGWWKDGMTGDGKKVKDKWVRGDIVIVKFDKDLAQPKRTEDWFELFRVKAAERDHKKLKDGCYITVNPLVEVGGHTNRHKISTTTSYKFMSTQLTGVAPDEMKIISGNPSKQDKLVVELDIDSYMHKQVADGADERAMEDTAVDSCSLKSVMGALPMFKNERSRVVQLIEERRDWHGDLIGHDAGFSAKCHCECAGHGIEYGNGRSKWHFRSHVDSTREGMIGLAHESMSNAVISLEHAMKYARKARDFFRAYRCGSGGWEVEKQRALFKTHRCMLDCYYTFITED
jgi:hypothetical protein